MGFIGKKGGLKKSEIIDKLGPDYFGISVDILEQEIDACAAQEYQNIVDPVYTDEKGNAYLIFTGPGNTVQRFYFHEHGYQLDESLIKIENRS